MTFHAAWTCETLLTLRTLVRLLSSVNYLVNLKAFFNPETLSNQIKIKSLLLSHHHSTSALVSEILMSVLQTVQKKQQQTIYIWTAFTVLQTVQKKIKIYIWTVHIYRLYRRQCAKYTYKYSVHSVL